MIILYVLILGLIVFCIYAKRKGFSSQDILHMCWDGIWSAHNVFLTFLLIGILTGLWRAAGTIPVIICYAQVLIIPKLFYLMTFLLCCLVSILTGTAFGTAATMGVICATMGGGMHLSSVLIGGAVLSGVYFGDRCSPVSTSALLVSEITNTDIFDNIRNMLKTALMPFVLTCLFYGILGLTVSQTHVDLDLTDTFGQVFQLHWTALLPALLILLLSAFRLPVKQTMLLSILSAIPVCLLVQKCGIDELVRYSILGYSTDNEAVAQMINGGGLISMLRVSAIVCISSAYSGIFQKTDLLDEVHRKMVTLANRITPFGAMLLTSIPMGAVACNQTLTIMLTKQLCESIETDRRQYAIDLENTAVVTAALIPWSIASGVPLSSVGAPLTSILCAVFLYLLPVYTLIMKLKDRKSMSSSNSGVTE